MATFEFMKLWRKNVAAEDETEVFVILPNGILCHVIELYFVEETEKLILSDD